MQKLAEHVHVLHPPELIPVDLELGSCAIALTTNPFVMPPVLNTKCYAVLADWLTPAAPVGMTVTFRVYTPAGRAQPAIEVHTVFAVEEMRGRRNPAGETIPVRIGRWMFEEGYLTLHSPDRTDKGDMWARQVGGELPPRQQVGTAENAALNGQLIWGDFLSSGRVKRPSRWFVLGRALRGFAGRVGGERVVGDARSD